MEIIGFKQQTHSTLMQGLISGFVLLFRWYHYYHVLHWKSTTNELSGYALPVCRLERQTDVQNFIRYRFGIARNPWPVIVFLP